MNWYKNISIRVQLSIPLVMIGIVLLGGMNTTYLNKSANQIAREFLTSLHYLTQADRGLYQTQVAERSSYI